MSKVHLVFGSQGAGKSTYAKKLAENINGVHLSIDEWMSELYGADLPKPMDLKWIMERVERCEKRIWTTAKQVSVCGGNVILDLGLMKVKNRDAFLNLAKEASVIKLKTKANHTKPLGMAIGRNQNNKIWGMKEKKKKTTNSGIISELSI